MPDTATSLVRVRLDATLLAKIDERVSRSGRRSRAAILRALIAAAIDSGLDLSPHLEADPVKRGRAIGAKTKRRSDDHRSAHNP